jgi:hypothetical protein
LETKKSRKISDNQNLQAQFNGHSHRDEFEVYYDSATATHAINVAWNGGGATAFSFVNPNYHVMYVDRTHYVSSALFVYPNSKLIYFYSK